MTETKEQLTNIIEEDQPFIQSDPERDSEIKKSLKFISALGQSEILQHQIELVAGQQLENIFSQREDEKVVVKKGTQNETAQNDAQDSKEKGDEEVDEIDHNSEDTEGEERKESEKIEAKVQLPPEPKQIDAGVQMPEWTAALEVEYMTQDQLAKVLNKLREDGLSEDDIRLGEDLYYRRASFKMDQFVKMSEIRNVVKEALNSLFDRLQKQDQTSRSNRAQIDALESKVKVQQQTINHLKRIENGQNQLISMLKTQEVKLIETQVTVQDWKNEAERLVTERAQFDKELVFEMTRTKAVSEQCESRVNDLERRRLDAEDAFVHFQDEIRRSYVATTERLKAKYEEIPDKLAQNELLMQKIKEELVEKQKMQFAQICENLKIDATKILEIEGEIANFKQVAKKVNFIDVEINGLKLLDDKVAQAHVFIERILPMFVHNQLCEGLNIIAGNNLKELMQWEIKKTDEVYVYSKLCEGHQPNISKLRSAIEKFTLNAWKYQIGSAPFTYGKNLDYWPEMKKIPDYDKRPFQKTRHICIEQKILEAQQAQKAQTEEHLQYLFFAERDATKALIKKELIENNSDFQRGTVLAKQAFLTDQRGPSTKLSRQNLNQKEKGRVTEPIHDSQERKLNMMLKIPESVKSQISQIAADPYRPAEDFKVEIDGIQENYTYGSSIDQSQSQTYREQHHKQNIIQNFKTVHHFIMVKKLDKLKLARMKKEQREFMANGRSEFNTQLLNWQEAFEENQEDFSEMVFKIDELQAKSSILTNQVEELKLQIQQIPFQVLRFSEKGAEKKQVDNEDENSVGLTEISEDIFFKKMAIGRRNTTLPGKQENETVQSNQGLDTSIQNQKQKSRAMTMYQKNPSNSFLANIDQHLQEIKEKNSESDEIITPENELAPQNISQSLASHNFNQEPSLGGKKVEQNTQMSKFASIQKSRKSVSFSQTPSEQASIPFGKSNQMSGQPIRQRRISKLELTQQRLQKLATGAESQESRVVVYQARKKVELSSATSSSEEDEVSSLNTEEKDENAKFSLKTSGASFNFAKEFYRNTMSRSALTSFVKSSFDKLQQETQLLKKISHDRYESILKEKEKIKEQNSQYQAVHKKELADFTFMTAQNAAKKSQEMEKLLLERINVTETHVKDFEVRLGANETQIKRMKEQIEQEYHDFSNQRKRWKTEFDHASEKAIQNLDMIRDMLSECESNNKMNTDAVKHLLDAQMIEQLIQRQDISDRQQILCMAFKTDKNLLATDLGANSGVLKGPKIVKHERVKSLKINTIGEPEIKFVTKTLNHTAMHRDAVPVESTTKDYDRNASKTDPPVFRVDRNCMNCAENKAKTLNAIKVACLTHIQSPIPYQGRDYHVSDVLDIKAQVVAQCQRLLRAYLYKSNKNSGIYIRNQDNEKSFIIKPLSKVKPIQIESTLKDLLAKNLISEKGLSEVNTSTFLQEGNSSRGPNENQSFLARQETLHEKNPKEQGHFKRQSDSMLLGIGGGREQKIGGAEDIQIDSFQHNISSNESSDVMLTPLHIQVTQRKIQRGASQLTGHKDGGHTVGLSRGGGLNQFRSATNSIIRNLPNEDSIIKRSSLFENSRFETSGGHLPEVMQTQKGSLQNKSGNYDIGNMFDRSQSQNATSTTKHSQVRHGSVLTGRISPQQSLMQKTGMSSTRYGSNKFGKSAMEQYTTNSKDNHRATDGFKNTQKQKLDQKKHSELLSDLVNRPLTEENNLLNSGKRINQSFKFANKK